MRTTIFNPSCAMLRWFATGAVTCCLNFTIAGWAASPYAGVYKGNFSGADTGVFYAFVGDGGTGDVLAYSTHYDVGGYAAISVNQNGGLSGSGSGGVTLTGTISGSSVVGSLNGQAGASSFSGNKLSSTGIQQANAGYYEGNIAGGATGPLKIILAADGTTAFYVAPSTSSEDDGGSGTINAAGQFSATSVQGGVVSGSVNSTTHVISGTWSGGGYSGTFSATRTQTFTALSTPWPDATDLGNGKMQSSWFGIFNDTYYPWIYHQQHGWMYVFGTDPSSIWLYDQTGNMGFLWTGSGVYPWMWSDQKGTWLYYSKGSSSPRWFFNWNTQTWERH